jgi:hypothetical protein
VAQLVANEPFIIKEENAQQILDWLRNRGGLAIWESINLSNPGMTWTTPALDVNGAPTLKPSWEASSTPVRYITSDAEVVVASDCEVKRFHVAIRMASNGLSFKVSDGGSRRIWREVSKAGKGAYHQFSYDTQDAVILRPEKLVPLTEWSAA